MKSLFLLGLIATISTSVYAGDKGNGGDVVICYQEDAVGRTMASDLNQKLKRDHEYAFYVGDPLLTNIVVIYSYDLWVYQHKVSTINPNGPQLYQPQGQTDAAIIEEILTRARNLTTGVQSLEDAASRLSWQPYSGVSEVNDEGRRGLPDANCVRLQMVDQTHGEAAFNHLLYTSGKMPPLHQAALKIHEFFKFLALINGQDNNSFYIHDIVGQLFATDADFQKIDPIAFGEIWKQATGTKFLEIKTKIENQYIFADWYGRHAITPTDDGWLQGGIMHSIWRIKPTRIRMAKMGVYITLDEKIYTTDNGEISYGKIKKGEHANLQTASGDKIQVLSDRWVHFENSYFAGGVLAKDVIFSINGYRVCFSKFSNFEVHPNGIPKAGSAYYSTKKSNGHNPNKRGVWFDENGEIIDKGLHPVYFEKLVEGTETFCQ